MYKKNISMHSRLIKYYELGVKKGKFYFILWSINSFFMDIFSWLENLLSAAETT